MRPRAVHTDGPRIEAAFRDYFYRARPVSVERAERHEKKAAEAAAAAAAAAAVAVAVAAAPPGAGADGKEKPAADGGADAGGPPPKGAEGAETKHEFEIVVCHGNVIRFFMMRALQLPPEAWLRLCTFNCR
jgi:serine/threonine-protein phosphatase PGAM5